MIGPEQTFIDAYRPHASSRDGMAESERRQAPAASRTVNGTQDTRYRIDAADFRPSPVPAPHLRTASTQLAGSALAACTIQVSMWDTMSAVPPDASFVSANVFTQPSSKPSQPNAPPQESPPAAPENAKSSQTDKTAGETEKEYKAHDSGADRQTASIVKKFKPVWEVDRFAWPAELNRFYEAEAAYFQHAGEKLREASEEGLRVLAVASSRSGEGCTTLAICLARAASATGIKVAILDANFQNPRLVDRAGLKCPHGWQETIRHDVPLEEAAIISLQDSLTILPLTESVSEHRLALTDADAANLIRAVAESADLVVVDAGSIDAEEADADKQLGNFVNAAIVVRDVRRTSEQETLATALHLKHSGIPAVGIAENYSPRNKTRNRTAA